MIKYKILFEIILYILLLRFNQFNLDLYKHFNLNLFIVAFILNLISNNLINMYLVKFFTNYFFKDYFAFNIIKFNFLIDLSAYLLFIIYF